MKTKKFKKGELTAESLKVLLYDLDCLEIPKTEDNKYHFKLLVNNLIDIFGKKTYCKFLEQTLLEDGTKCKVKVARRTK